MREETFPESIVPDKTTLSAPFDWKVAWRPLVAFLLVPNLLFALAGARFPIHRGFVDVTYLFVGLLVLIIPGSVTGFLLFFSVLILDVLHSFSGVYYFTPEEAFKYLGEIRHLSLSVVLPIAVALAVPLLLVCLTVSLVNGTRRNPVSRRTCAWVLAFALLAGGVVMVEEWVIFHGPPAAELRLPVSFFLENELADTLTFMKQPKSVRNFSVLRRVPELSQGRDVVFVLEESMGQSATPELTDQLLKPLTSEQVRERYDVIRGNERFSGSTVNGESRTLCSADAGISLSKGHEQAQADCLPFAFRHLGYETFAFHGFTGEMFDRHTWYPLVGFEHTSFREDQRRRFPQTCGKPFPGTCDTQMAEFVTEALLHKPAGQKRFIYWLTLASHLPVDAATARSSDFNCGNVDATRHEQGVCNVSKVLAQTNEAIAKIVLDRRTPPTIFVLMGDHAPPFQTTAERKNYDQLYVPYLILLPKQKATGGSQLAGLSRQAGRAKSSVR